MNHNTMERLSKNERKVEKYISAFLEKVPQAIVQARCGKKECVSYKPSKTEVYEIAVENNPDILEQTNRACEDINPLKPFSLCVEILLKTADGDTLVLEAWQLRLEPSEKFWQQNYRMFADCETVFGHLMILLKSIIAVTRIIPAFKMSLSQSAETYVMLYRIYQGDPKLDQLGTSPQHNKIGEVYTPVGTISVSVAYRSKSEMTIAPQRAGKDNFMVKSDYFDVDLNPEKQLAGGIQLKKSKSTCQNSTYQNVGAFAPCSSLPDAAFPELAFLEKPFLNLSRGTFQRSEKKSTDNLNVTDSNLNIIDDPKNVKVDEYHDKDYEKLSSSVSCSDLSDGSDFVLIDMPSFARCDSDNDLGVFFKECQSAPPLPSLSGQTTLKDQVCDITSQLAKFETSLSDFDSFVDSVCQLDLK